MLLHTIHILLQIKKPNGEKGTTTHLAGDGSFKKKFIDFCQFRLNLLIKIFIFLILKIFYPGAQKLWPKKYFFLPFLQKNVFFVVISLKLVKIIGVCEVNFFFKI